MIFSCLHSSKMDSRVVFDSAHNSAKGESHTDLAGIRIMMKVILQNGLAFPQKLDVFSRVPSVIKYMYFAVLHLSSRISKFQLEDKSTYFHYKQ